MGLPPQLEADLKILSEEGYFVKAIRDPPEGPKIYILFENYSLPSGWKNGDKRKSKLLLITDISYPNSKMDMFWLEKGVLLENGGIPKNGDVIENHIGEEWRRFSWHVQKWNPAVDNVITYLNTVKARLSEKR